MQNKEKKGKKSSVFQVATANTHNGRLLRHVDGLLPLVNEGVDILLMQEVAGISKDELYNRLRRDGFQLLVYATKFGLAIALSDTGAKRFRVGDIHTRSLHRLPPWEAAFARLSPDSPHFRLRGLQVLRLKDSDDNEIIVANLHLAVITRLIARRSQLQLIYNHFSSVIPKEHGIIIAGDFNHYPSPRGVDYTLQSKLGLNRVALNDKTWQLRQSNHAWTIKIISQLGLQDPTWFDGELDAILYRGLHEHGGKVVTLESDHRAIISGFSF